MVSSDLRLVTNGLRLSIVQILRGVFPQWCPILGHDLAERTFFWNAAFLWVADDVFHPPNAAVLSLHLYVTRTWGHQLKTIRDFVKVTLGPMFESSKVTKDLKVMALDDNRMWLPGWADTVSHSSTFSAPVQL